MLMVNQLNGFGAGGVVQGGGGSYDPHLDKVVLLMHMEGANGSTTFTDVKGHIFTASGGAQITTSQAAVGSSSLGVTAIGYTPQRITTPDSEDFALSNGDFTIEARVRLTAANSGSSYRFFISQVGSGGDDNNRQFAVGIHTTNGLNLYFTTTGANDQSLAFPTTFSLNTFYAISISRVGNTFYAHKDGIFLSSASSSLSFYNSTAVLSIGAFGGYATLGYNYLDWAGQIDELRLTKGVGRYTNSDYTLAPFPDA